MDLNFCSLHQELVDQRNIEDDAIEYKISHFVQCCNCPNCTSDRNNNGDMLPFRCWLQQETNDECDE